MSNTEVSRKRGSAFDITFTYGSAAGDISSDTFTYIVRKKNVEGVVVITKNDSDFNKAQGASQIVSCNITSTESDITPGKYFSEIKRVRNSTTDVQKSDPPIDFIIKKAGT